jgi:hypothetical protein
MLPEIRIASPCTANWEEMTGDARARHCAECNLDVYNFSAMTSHEVEQLLGATKGQRVCGRFYRRTDGTILTSDCPVGFRARVRRVSRVAGAALTAAMSVGSAAAQVPQQESALTQITPEGAGLAVIVVDENGARIPKAQVFISDEKRGEFSKGQTDSTGEFRTASLTTGSYIVTVQATGFQTRSESVSIGSQESLNLRVELGVVGVNLGVISLVEHATLEPTLRTVPDLLPVSVEKPPAMLPSDGSKKSTAKSPARK